MDITFWVIQAVLLTPVLFMAASVGMEEHPSRGRRAVPWQNTKLGLTPLRGKPEPDPQPVTSPSLVAAAAASLSQFTVEQQARLLILRSSVQEARSGRGTLTDDLLPDDPVTNPDLTRPDPSPAHDTPSRGSRRGPGAHQLLVIGGVLLMVIGLIGAVRTSLTMDDLQRNSLSAQAPLSVGAKFLPGVLVNPSKYLSAVNGGGGSTGGGSSRVDQFYAVSQMEQKQAMDRWEALLGIGLGLVLFANAMRVAAAASSSESEENTSVAVDFAPFVLVAAVVFAALSFFELP